MRFCFETSQFVDQEINSGKLAVVGENSELTWLEFEREANKLIDFLKENGANELTDSVVVYGHKSANMVVCAYALMKLKIPYIPVDEAYPLERVQKIISASKSQLLINTSENGMAFEDVAVLNFTNEILELVANKIKFTSQSIKPADPLVYIIFTSGSTGEPKGVQISTEAVQSFTRWMTSEDFGYSASSVFINTALLSFDLSVFELMTFGALGATLVLNSKQQTSDPNILLERVQKYKGTVWVSTPSFAFIYARIDNNVAFDQIESFLFCGEVLPHPLAKTLVEKYPNSRVVNTYGPTEATVATTVVNITPEILEKHNPLPVGKSKMESQLLIENDEIVIVGPNVATGYINRPDLNELKFTIIDGQRAFRTGDKGYLENDMLFFYGRNDDMVKLHGYRIELNEITSVLNDLDYVLQSATIPLKRDEIVKKIVSIVQLQPNTEISVETIKSDLEKNLPKYMVPSDIKLVENIPLNQNGKADKSALLQLYLTK